MSDSLQDLFKQASGENKWVCNICGEDINWREPSSYMVTMDKKRAHFTCLINLLMVEQMRLREEINTLKGIK